MLLSSVAACEANAFIHSILHSFIANSIFQLFRFLIIYKYAGMHIGLNSLQVLVNSTPQKVNLSMRSTDGTVFYLSIINIS